ncbi:MAG: hypothetical protein GX066_05665 [Clostridiaceae bacterium]|nr:hypothetical protein [Clostridiaceae bacterium]
MKRFDKNLRIKEYKIHNDNAFPGSGNIKHQDEEIGQLKKRIADLEEENAIPKKPRPSSQDTRISLFL